MSFTLFERLVRHHPSGQARGPYFAASDLRPATTFHTQWPFGAPVKLWSYLRARQPDEPGTARDPRYGTDYPVIVLLSLFLAGHLEPT